MDLVDDAVVAVRTRHSPSPPTSTDDARQVIRAFVALDDHSAIQAADIHLRRLAPHGPDLAGLGELRALLTEDPSDEP